MEILVEFDETRIRLLDEIKQRAGLRDYKEILNNGITLLDWATRERAAGRIVATMNENTRSYKKLKMEALERVIPQAGRSK
jgi:hypothetical protein